MRRSKVKYSLPEVFRLDGTVPLTNGADSVVEVVVPKGERWLLTWAWMRNGAGASRNIFCRTYKGEVSDDGWPGFGYEVLIDYPLMTANMYSSWPSRREEHYIYEGREMLMKEGERLEFRWKDGSAVGTGAWRITYTKSDRQDKWN